ncbi:MAG TPA: BON domain-containing protein [Myxococcota bacterium]
MQILHGGSDSKRLSARYTRLDPPNPMARRLLCPWEYNPYSSGDSSMQRRSRFITRAIFGAALALTMAGAANAAQRTDAWITTKVKMSLLTSEGVSATNVNVDTVDGRVTLHGSVPTEAEKTRAEQVASKVDGASKVRNLLQVVAPRNEAKTEATDDQVEERVKANLKASRALADSSITVQSVNAGVVLLAGKAATLSDAYRAVGVTAAVPGVRRVASEIQSPDTLGDKELWYDGAYDAAVYEGSAAGDTWITTAAKVRLIASSDTPGFDINVDTNNGIVTLFGVVASEQAKRAAEAEVRKVGGVKNVVNDLQIVAEAKQDRVEQKDDQISKAIQTRIDTVGGLDDSDIDIAVSNGVARLSGTVVSRTDQVAALTVARSTAGVRRVIDDMRLEPPAVSSR